MKIIVPIVLASILCGAEARSQSGGRRYGPPRSNSLADRADAVEASMGLPIQSDSSGMRRDRVASPEFSTVPYGFRGPRYGGVRPASPYYRPAPFVHPDVFPPTGPVRMLRGAGGEVLPEYLVPYGHRAQYRFAGWR